MILFDEKRLKRLKVTYGIALTFIALTMLGSSFLMKYSIDRSRGDSRVINLSGRQRMLSQRLTKCVLTLERATPDDAQGRIGEIAESLSAWKAAHLGLQRGDEKLELQIPRQSPDIAAQFARIEPFFAAMSQALEGLLAHRSDPESVHAVARVMLDNEPRFLELMDTITFQFDKEARDRVLAIQRLEWGILAMGLLVLLLEFIFVFRPSLSELARHSRALQRINLRLEKEAANARDLTFKAEAASGAKSEFLAVMSHELRTPLNGVLGFADILASTPLDDEQRGYAVTIKNCGEHLLAVVNDILDFSSLEKGALRLHIAPLAVADLVDLSIQTVQKSADDKGIEFRCVVASGVPERIAGDKRRISQILINLLGNAVKFTSTGSVVLLVATASEGEGQVLNFSVEDTGPGIPPETLGRLFKPFTQADSTRSRMFQGTGLGLAISKCLAEAMNGSITVVSVPGKGSTFVFRLPIGFAPPGHPPSADDPPIGESVSPAGTCVLVVDDNETNSKLAGTMLRSLGYRVEFAANGAEAVEAFAPGKFSAILMDVRMPVMDGLEATKRIRGLESGTRVPVIALTANVMPDNHRLCLAVGMDDILTKPFTKAELAAKLANVAQR
ncbi:MAG: ATP-binding protein [Verrucomicrobiae bacterium]